MGTNRYYLPGIILLLIALMILAVPEILIAFVASIVVMAGIGALYIGHKIRKSRIKEEDLDDWISDENFFGRRFVRRPEFRNWHRWF